MTRDEIKTGILNALKMRKEGREQWIKGTLLLCELLSAGRKQFDANDKFGAWLMAEGLDVLSKDERASAITMGNHPEVLKEILETTNRWSIRMIHMEEFAPRFKVHFAEQQKIINPAPQNVRVTEQASSQCCEDEAPKQGPVTPQQSLPQTPIENVISNLPPVQQFAKEAEEDEEEIDEEDEEEAPPPPLVQRGALDELKISLNVQTTRTDIPSRPPPTPVPVTPQSNKKTRREMEKEYQRKYAEMEAEIKAKVMKETREWVDAYFIPNYGDRIARAERIVAAQKGVFTEQEYMLLKRVCHPDNSASVEARNKAFTLLQSKEDVLVKQPPRQIVTDLPKTWDEVMARANTAKEKV